MATNEYVTLIVVRKDGSHVLKQAIRQNGHAAIMLAGMLAAAEHEHERNVETIVLVNGSAVTEYVPGGAS